MTSARSTYDALSFLKNKHAPNVPLPHESLNDESTTESLDSSPPTSMNNFFNTSSPNISEKSESPSDQSDYEFRAQGPLKSISRSSSKSPSEPRTDQSTGELQFPSQQPTEKLKSPSPTKYAAMTSTKSPSPNMSNQDALTDQSTTESPSPSHPKSVFMSRSKSPLPNDQPESQSVQEKIAADQSESASDQPETQTTRPRMLTGQSDSPSNQAIKGIQSYCPQKCGPGVAPCSGNCQCHDVLHRLIEDEDVVAVLMESDPDMLAEICEHLAHLLK
ncbi:hypothetical protein L596_006604 [Steinernema carpocapsae]|uniref:Uncharacterized protein n=2 Tax=Steinernema carpocapsae TaxID=34508 RepID=A0A4U8V503_STECR|nr:hypothetical protein L596_006604 [Steinernema carpocapsae]